MSDEDPNDDRTSGSEDLQEEELDSGDDNSGRPSTYTAGDNAWEGQGGANGEESFAGGNSFAGGESFAGEEPMNGPRAGRRNKQPPLDVKDYAEQLMREGKQNAFLRGMLERNFAGDHVFKGQWALGYFEFYNPVGLKSDFEFKHKATDADETEIFPLAGKYEGWYKLREGSNLKKHDDKELYLTFVLATDGKTYNVGGHGRNEYGQYSCMGKLSEIVGTQGTLEIFRIYNINTTATAATAAAAADARPQPLPARRLSSKAPGDAASVSGASLTAPKTRQSMGGGAARIDAKRRSGSGMGMGMGMVAQSKAPAVKTTTSAPTIPKILSEKHAAKARNLIKNLREMCAAAIAWFERPVNEALAPNYHAIIKQPMDLAKVEGKLKKRSYKEPADFISDMRLIFRNAMTYNVEGDSCYNDALTCSKYFEELFKKYCSDFDLAYDDGGRLDGAGGAGGAAGKQKLKPKLLTATNVGPRPINAAAAPQTQLGGAGLAQGGGGQLTDALVAEYREQIMQAGKNLARAEMDKARLQGELDLARERIQELETELYRLRGGPPPGGMRGDIMQRQSSHAGGGGQDSSANRRGSYTAEAPAQQPAIPVDPAEVHSMREELKSWISALSSDPQLQHIAAQFVGVIQSLGINPYNEGDDEVTIDLDAYGPEVIVTLYRWVRELSAHNEPEAEAQEAAPMEEETPAAQEASAAAPSNGPTTDGGAESKQGGGRLKRDRSDDADDDDAMAVEEEEEGQPAKKAKEAEQQRQEGGAGVDEGAEAPAATSEAPEAKQPDAAATTADDEREEEVEEEQAPAPPVEEEEEEEEVSGAAVARWGSTEGEAEGGKDKPEEEEEEEDAGKSELWDQARREKEEEMRRAEERKKQEALQEELLRQKREEATKMMLEAQRQKEEEEKRKAEEEEEAKREEEAKKKAAMEKAREEARAKRLNQMA